LPLVSRQLNPFDRLSFGNIEPREPGFVILVGVLLVRIRFVFADAGPTKRPSELVEPYGLFQLFFEGCVSGAELDIQPMRSAEILDSFASYDPPGLVPRAILL